MIDDRVGDLIRRRLSGMQDELLDRDMSPLGTFSARTLLARGMGWISEEASRDLDQIRKVRNAFAHKFDHQLSFDDQSVTDRCRNLKTAQSFLNGLEEGTRAPDQMLSEDVLREVNSQFTHPRQRFEISVMFLLQYLDDPNKDLMRESHETGLIFRIGFSGSGTSSPPGA
jgi:hypothetical protein